MKPTVFLSGVLALGVAAGGIWALWPETPAQAQSSTGFTAASLPPLATKDDTLDSATPAKDGRKKAVVFGGLDTLTARTFTFEVPIGKSVRFKKLTVVPRECHRRPPEETPETAVFAEVYQPEGEGASTLRRIFSGWMFASSPGLNGLEHPVLDIWVIGCKVDDPDRPEMAEVSLPPKAFSEGTEEEEVVLPSADDIESARE